MVSLPPGVELYDSVAASEQVRRNVIVSVSGPPKSGKTNFGTHVRRPLYYCMLDAHDNLAASLLAADAAGYTGPAYIKRIPTMRYSALSDERAAEILREINTFANWAKGQATIAKAEGKPTGTFVLDGMVKFKGYVEKALLGESATLGFRAKAGQPSGISTYDYAESNAYIMDFIAGFANGDLDVVLTWEGRRIWVNDEKGRGRPTDRYRSSMPETSLFAINVEVETMMPLKDVIVANQKVGQVAEPKLRIGYNGYNASLVGRVLPGQTLDELKELLFSELPEVEAKLDPVDTVYRMPHAEPILPKVEEDDDAAV